MAMIIIRTNAGTSRISASHHGSGMCHLCCQASPCSGEGHLALSKVALLVHEAVNSYYCIPCHPRFVTDTLPASRNCVGPFVRQRIGSLLYKGMVYHFALLT